MRESRVATQPRPALLAKVRAREASSNKLLKVLSNGL